MTTAVEHKSYVEVALPVPLRKLFTYRVTDALQGQLEAGSRVAVPFNRRKLAGFAVAVKDTPPEGVKRVLNVAGLLEDAPVFPEELFTFLQEAAKYYMHPLGEVLKAAAPALPTGAMKRLRAEGFLEDAEALPGKRIAYKMTLVATRTGLSEEGVRIGVKQRAVLDTLADAGELWLETARDLVADPRAVFRALEKKGLIELEERDAPRDRFFSRPVSLDAPPPPTPAQATAIDAICGALERGERDAFLLHGVTGSGKTEVYLRAIETARSLGRGALLLVPEIALTPQLVARFRARFGDEIAVLHSGLTGRRRHDAWQALRLGHVHIAVGARSALFAPIQSLGIVIVDEEHDPSFKQEEGFRYHARDMALLRAHRAGAVSVLGSATPSLEMFHRASTGAMKLLSMPMRATGQSMPRVEVVDLRRHRGGPGGSALLSGPFHKALGECLGAGHQAIVFLNRRGFSPSVRCLACGTLAECPACSVALTEHRRAAQLRCHYCDYHRGVEVGCQACGAKDCDRVGMGTEKLQEAISAAFPEARVGRLDRDTAAGDGVEAVLGELRRGDVDVLVGTQMVTKGHDIANVTLVGVALADQSLAFPDFRAAERTFQLLSQVSGRAGRAEHEGTVFFQTYQPEHPAVMLAAMHDYEAFTSGELERRHELLYPPFSRLVAVRVDAGSDAVAHKTCQRLASVARRSTPATQGAVQVLGPAPAPIARLRGRFRYRLLLKSADRRAVREVAAAVLRVIEEGVAPARASIDIDPVSML